jgi:hypothetical protein
MRLSFQNGVFLGKGLSLDEFLQCQHMDNSIALLNLPLFADGTDSRPHCVKFARGMHEQLVVMVGSDSALVCSKVAGVTLERTQEVVSISCPANLSGSSISAGLNLVRHRPSHLTGRTGTGPLRSLSVTLACHIPGRLSQSSWLAKFAQTSAPDEDAPRRAGF